MRQLTESLFNELKLGQLRPLLEYVKNDDTLDMEFRRNYITLYYRGGEILTVKERSVGKYSWKGLTKKYLLKGEKEYIPKHTNVKDFGVYIPEAKHIMDRYIILGPKNHLGEKEIQQLVVKENNYSKFSNDTDYFIVDMEYEEGKEGDGRFDLIALRWDSNVPARRKNEVSLAVIEVKQGIKSVASSKSSPGLRIHQEDFNAFVQKKRKANILSAFCNDMLMIFKQKCALGLILGNDRTDRMTIDDKLKCLEKIDFICLLANYKAASSNLVTEIMGKGVGDSMRPCKLIVSNYLGYGLFSANIIDISSGIEDGSTYLDSEKRKQALLYANEARNGGKGLFGSAKNFGGVWNSILSKWYHYPYILQHEDSLFNLFSGIREDVMDYFERHDIAWWCQDSDRYFPTGNLVSSQIHCLNHLFAMRTDKIAVKQMIENATGMTFDEVLPSLIDNTPNSFISFEFAFHNDEWLHENDKGSRRGTMCTSIDVMIFARKGKQKWLIPIEWKYTETYDREDKTNRRRLNRYSHLIEISNRLFIPKDGIPHSVYFIEPNYELMRQTILCEQIVAQGYADNFVHLNVISKGNTELRKAVESEFIPMLKDPSKFRIVDSQDLLAPLKGNDKYADLLDYLQKRYW